MDEAVREAIRTRLRINAANRKQRQPVRPPRYDEVYFAGLEWLDSLAGPPIEEGTLCVFEIAPLVEPRCNHEDGYAERSRKGEL